jgi:hypothetical protein
MIGLRGPLTAAGGFILLLLVLSSAVGRDLERAVVVCPGKLSGPERKAVTMLIEEVAKRSRVRWNQATRWPDPGTPVIAVGTKAQLKNFAGPYHKQLQALPQVVGAEGYRLWARSGPANPAVFVIGNDSRGLLFGIGRLLREMRMQRGSVTLPEELEVATAPKYPLRGHQLGYRPKCNSYDAWDLPVWEQYYRDLAVFGCNAIELIPPRSDDAADSPHFPRPPMEMMIGMSGLARDYGLDVWIWYPAMDKDYSDPKTVEFALKEWAQVFSKLPRIDAVFVPGGDPGHTQPKHLMALLEKQTQSLHRYHPKAQMWVSPQSFNQAWLDEFIGILQHDHPAWLSGVVFGPQVRVSLPRLRELVPAQYPIRHYPDITHSRQCQYPVENWDVAYALTEARECINPRPRAESAIFHKLQSYTIGFLTYSEGCNDDVNKMVWSALGWDPDAKLEDILREYGRYFIGPRYADDFGQGLMDLEGDWQGPLAGNEQVDATLKLFQALEKSAAPVDLKNWRLQQALFRAYYDAYTRHRLGYETGLETRALETLANTTDPEAAMTTAQQILDLPLTDRQLERWRLRIHELAEALFQSIGMQLSVEKYRAIDVDRGASLDTLEYPLNNRIWLKEQFARIRQMAAEPERRAALDQIVHWTDPGAGGFYDDLGDSGRQPHLVRPFSFAEDPGCMESVRVDFEEDLVLDEDEPKPTGARRVSWMDHVESLYDAPVQMRYTDLDPKARYKVRVVYGGDSARRKIRLDANGVAVHPFITKPFPIRPVEYSLPTEAMKSGELTLSWYGEPGLGGNGRACQVSEVWLMKEPSTTQ